MFQHKLSMVGRSRLISRSWLIDRSRSMVGRSRPVSGSNFIAWSCLVCWSRSMVRRSSIIMSLTRVRNISNISTVAISYIVVDSLSSAVRKSYTV